MDQSAFFQAAFQAASFGMALSDTKGRIVFANPRFALQLSTPIEALLGSDVLSLFSAPAGQNISLALAEYWEGVVATKVEGEESLHSLVMVALRSSHHERDGYLFELSAHQGEKAKGVIQELLAPEVAHDLNNVLTGIQGHISFLRLCLPAHGAHSESLHAVEDGTRRAARMAQQALESARGNPVTHSSTDIAQVVKAAVSILRGSLPPAIAMEVAGCEKECVVFGDEGQLGQVILNLLVNARDSMPRGGRLSVILQEEDFTEETSINGFSLRSGRYARVRIRDTGVGIPEGIRNKIFQAFFTTKGGRGTGLGLATVRTIIESHRGAIGFESAEGTGTEFSVYVRCDSSAKEISKRVSQNVPVSHGNEGILIVDDEEVVRTIIERSLEHLGYEVASAANGVDGIEVFRQNPSRYGLVILDMIMPQMGGDEVFRELRKVRPDIKVLIASGYASDVRTRAVLDGGAIGFLQKPFSVDELALEVRRCFDAPIEKKKK